MPNLVLDTSLSQLLAGLAEGPVVLEARREPMLKGHQEALGGWVRDLMAGTPFDTLDRVGVTVGPGSFTGLRVGLAFAQGLGAALDRPVIGLSTLDALAASAGEAPAVAALIDARRGQVYARFWIAGVATGPAEALSLEAARERAAALGKGAALVGSGATLVADAAIDPVVLPLDGPSAEALARLTAEADPALSPPRPLYLRAPDATPPSRLPGQPRPSVDR